MKLAISNIGWPESEDGTVYQMMRDYGFSGLEIAPTRIYPEQPYDHLEDAERWSEALFSEYGFTIASMQSIWYGKQEKIYGSRKEYEFLIDYTRKAADFAQAAGCANLVFGCPKNRCIPDRADRSVAMEFFQTIGTYAYEHETVIAIEPNPPIYQTNFLNTTQDAVAFIHQAACKGLALNLDTGTMIENDEGTALLKGSENLIHHVHISEPGLKPIQKRKLHTELASMLRDIRYQGFVSIEVGMQNDMQKLAWMMEYTADVFRQD